MLTALSPVTSPVLNQPVLLDAHLHLTSFERAKNIVYFDLETQKSADEVGGWDKLSRMRMSIGVTYSTKRGDYRIYCEKQVNDLVAELQRADFVVGFNNLRLD